MAIRWKPKFMLAVKLVENANTERRRWSKCEWMITQNWLAVGRGFRVWDVWTRTRRSGGSCRSVDYQLVEQFSNIRKLFIERIEIVSYFLFKCIGSNSVFPFSFSSESDLFKFSRYSNFPRWRDIFGCVGCWYVLLLFRVLVLHEKFIQVMKTLRILRTCRWLISIMPTSRWLNSSVGSSKYFRFCIIISIILIFGYSIFYRSAKRAISLCFLQLTWFSIKMISQSLSDFFREKILLSQPP